MPIGFTLELEEEEEYVPLYRTIIKCPICKDDLINHYKGFCSCKNLEVDEVETISKVLILRPSLIPKSHQIFMKFYLLMNFHNS